MKMETWNVRLSNSDTLKIKAKKKECGAAPHRNDRLEEHRSPGRFGVPFFQQAHGRHSFRIFHESVVRVPGKQHRVTGAAACVARRLRPPIPARITSTRPARRWEPTRSGRSTPRPWRRNTRSAPLALPADR